MRCTIKNILLPSLPFLVLAALWGIHFLYSVVYQWQMPAKYIQQPVLVRGVITSVPVPQFHGLKFTFTTKQFQHNVTKTKMRLSWYHHPPALKVGQEWVFWVKLKPPVGLHNPGGFDYAKWLRYHNVSATGYVLNKKEAKNLGQSPYFPLMHLRIAVEKKIDAAVTNKSIAGILSALSVGLRNELLPADWQVFQKTGTSHLVAISGLHIGLAVTGLFAITAFFWRQSPRLLIFLPAVRAAQVAGILGALIYTALSGFALPAERALIMTLCLLGGALLYRHLYFYQRILLALLLILVMQPAAIVSPSLLLSFYAVSILGYLLCARLSSAGGWRGWLRIQISLSIALIPLSLWFFQQSSVVSILANMIAIPWIGILIVPCLLFGVLVFLCGAEQLAAYCFQLSALLLKPLWALLTKLAGYDWSFYHHTLSSPWLLLAGVFGVFLCLLPAGIPARWLGCVGFFPLFLYQPAHPHKDDFWITVIDVGQGLSVLLQTAQHSMLYDTGGHIPGGFDVGASVVLPFLSYSGVQKLDMVMISHGDNDHSGGARSIVAALPVAAVLSSAPKVLTQFHGAYCHAGQHWVWDGIDFLVQGPATNVPYQDNNSSCILKVSNKAGSVLLTGDIEHSGERYLAEHINRSLRSTVLVVPHHGSKTSSSVAFLRKVLPEYAVISLGAYNHYHFPSSVVIKRFHAMGAHVYRTDKKGAISIRFLHTGQVKLAH